MSRTIKDIPYHVLAEKAYARGFVDNDRVSGYHYRYDDIVSFTIAVDSNNTALRHDWLSWVNALKTLFPVITHISNHVKNEYIIDEIDDEPIRRVAYAKAFRWIGAESWNRHGRYYGDKFIDTINDQCNPYSFALDINRSLAHTDYVDVIECKVIMNTREHDDRWDVIRTADVNAYIAYKGARDKHYKYGMKSYLGKHEDIYASRASVRDELIRARNSYNSGEDMDDYDSPEVYQNKPEVEWWY